LIITIRFFSMTAFRASLRSMMLVTQKKVVLTSTD
jgi:hypothetical protein